jgi:uncharacterized membrane protein HdeD (DUF308 family)
MGKTGNHMKKTGAGWRLGLGLILEALGILIALSSIGTSVMLMGLALSVLTVIVGMIQVSFWSRVRHVWL